jgi:lysozyme
MKISDAGLDLIKRSEGFRDRVYFDVAGKPTIGYGHLIKAGETFPSGVTEDQATDLLKADVAWAEAAVSRLVTVSLSQGQFDALVDFVFNLGAGTFKGSTLLKFLNACKYDEAGNEFAKWNKAGGKVQPGLVTRRAAELELWVVLTD